MYVHPKPIDGQTPAHAQDPLASWNDGPAKQAILAFVKEVTYNSDPKYVAPEDRIATFDQDGTLWVEHPIYTQVMYCLERVPALVEKKPELKNVEPFKTVISGSREAMAKLPMKDLEKILAATLTGMSVDEFSAEVKKWASTAKHPRWPAVHLAPYVFGGGGGVFTGAGGQTINTPFPEVNNRFNNASENVSNNRGMGHVGGGAEYRFTPHIGIFGEAGYNWVAGGNHERNSGVKDFVQVNFGLRYAF